jgi:hypothetical protein
MPFAQTSLRPENIQRSQKELRNVVFRVSKHTKNGEEFALMAEEEGDYPAVKMSNLFTHLITF